jgi:hypothetical protein
VRVGGVPVGSSSGASVDAGTPLSTAFFGEPDDSFSVPSGLRNESMSSCTAPSGGMPPYIVQMSVMLQPFGLAQNPFCVKQAFR